MRFTASRSYKSKKKSPSPVQPSTWDLDARLSPDEAERVHADPVSKGARCTECTLYGLKRGPVPSEIRPNSKLLVIGDKPSEHSVSTGTVFQEIESDQLHQWLAEGDIQRENVSFTCVTACAPIEHLDKYETKVKLQWRIACAAAKEKGDLLPPEPLLPTVACLARLEHDVKLASCKTVLTLDEPALGAFAKVQKVPYGTSKKVKAGVIRIASIKKQIGAPSVMPDGSTLIASYHPKFAARPPNLHWRHALKGFIIKAANIANRGGKIKWIQPKFILNPTVEQIEETLGLFYRNKTRVSVDIETDKGTRKDKKFDVETCRIRCIGFAGVVNNERISICVPLRYINGDTWWPDANDKTRVLQACMDVLNECELLGQNFVSFDTRVLLRTGLITSRRKQHLDTILAHRNTLDCDLPHDLGFITARYIEAPFWKGLIDDKVIEDVSDEDLHDYNLKDCWTVYDIWPLIENDLYRLGTVQQYLQDQELAPIARDAGVLGVFVDEEKRAYFSSTFAQEINARLKRIRELTNDNTFNPDAHAQIQRFLFGIKKLVPKINAKGKLLAKDENPSTNVTCLMAILLDKTADGEAKEFINTLLEYRAYVKLKSTYVDNLAVEYPNWAEYGYEVKTLPAVYEDTFVEYTKKERAEIAKERFPFEWERAATIPVAYSERIKANKDKTEKAELRKQAKAIVKAQCDELLKQVETGRMKRDLVFPERPAISRLRLNYLLHQISSGRWAVRPNIQAFPCVGKANMREMIIAPPGHLIVGADYDQVELKLYIAISGDRMLWQAIREKRDLHSWNAGSLFSARFGKTQIELYEELEGYPEVYKQRAITRIEKNGLAPLDSKIGKKVKDFCIRVNLELTDENRKKAEIKLGEKEGEIERKKIRNPAKTTQFSITYGAMEAKFVTMMLSARDKSTGALMFPGMTEEDAAELYRAWHLGHPETRQFNDKASLLAAQQGYIASRLGVYRKRYLPGGTNKPGIPSNHENQSSAAEMTNDATIKINKQIPYQHWSPFTGMCIQAHDYLGWYVPEDRADETIKIIEKAMNQEHLGMKFTATANKSLRWSEQ